MAKAVAVGLRSRGIDVVTAPEAGLLGADDMVHLAFALSERRVVFTQDDDFLKLAARGIPHCGIVHVPQQTGIGDILRGLSLIFHILSAEDMLENVEFL